MAHFIGGVCGNRGEATRLGTSGSGMHCYANGWNFGCRIDLNNNMDGEDEVLITLTGGTNHNVPLKNLGTFTIKDLK